MGAPGGASPRPAQSCASLRAWCSCLPAFVNRPREKWGYPGACVPRYASSTSIPVAMLSLPKPRRKWLSP